MRKKKLSSGRYLSSQKMACHIVTVDQFMLQTAKWQYYLQGNVYSRRGEGQSIWVVKSIDIVSSDPDEKEENFSSDDKIYRHPTFYNVPDDVGHM